MTVLDPAYPGGVDPCIAERREIAANAASITPLRDDATFTSGNPPTPQDVVRSFVRAMQVDLAKTSFPKTCGLTAERFVAAGDHAFMLNLPQPHDPWLIHDGALAALRQRDHRQHARRGERAERRRGCGPAGNQLRRLRRLRPSGWRLDRHVISTQDEGRWGEAPAMERALVRHLPESPPLRLEARSRRSGSFPIQAAP